MTISRAFFSSRRFVWVALLVTLPCAGCSKGTPRVPVAGKVMLDGKPLQFGGLSFQPDAGPAAHGAIGADGRFSLTGEDAVCVGRNVVSVACFEADAPNFRKPEGERSPGKSLIPERYMSFATSGIVIDVQPEMDDVVIELRVRK
jgi:hypothetical protein